MEGNFILILLVISCFLKLYLLGLWAIFLIFLIPVSLLLPVFSAQAFNIAQIQSFTALFSIYNVFFLLWFHPHLCFNNHMPTNGFQAQTLGFDLPVDIYDEL